LDAPPQRQLPPQRHQHKGLAGGGGGSVSGEDADHRVGRDKLNMEQAPTQRPPPVPPPKPAHMLRHACQSPQVPEVESPSGTAAPPPQLSDDSTDSRLTGDIPLQNESLNNPQSMTRWSDAVVCV
jgi:hypothetical protein